MANVILIRPISESWDGELYKRALSIPHGPLTLAAHLIHKGFSAHIIDEIALTEVIKTEISTKAINRLKDEIPHDILPYEFLESKVHILRMVCILTVRLKNQTIRL